MKVIDRERPTQKQKDIESQLRKHPKGGREILKIARLMPGATESARTAQAQLWAIAFVEDSYRGDVARFLGDYGEEIINYGSIIQYVGRRSLGLSPQDQEGKKIYG